MIDIELIREKPDDVADNLARRGVERADISSLAKLDKEWRTVTEETEKLRAHQNQANDEIAAADNTTRQQLIDQMRQVAADLKDKEAQLASLATQRDAAWRQLPNLVADDVPEGGEEDFAVIRSVPNEPPAPAGNRSYLDLFEDNGIDLARAAKAAGARFAYLTGDLVRLQMALVSFVFDKLASEHFTPVLPPLLINEAAMSGMGYLDRHADEIYRTQDDLYLIGTSEQAIGARHLGEVLDADTLPLRYVGYSSCFRREAGSHGRDVKGIMRMHQFDKVEMFSITTPDQSANEHELLLEQQEALVQALELPYRVVKLASRDLGNPSAKTYDIETWIPSENRYRETHSASNTTDYQTRRLNIRTKIGDETIKVHMLNATALALGRTLIALIENHQQADGSIKIPSALHGYLPFTEMTP